MEFASWLRNEEMRVEEFKKYKEEEQKTPLWIRDEVSKPRDVINNHHNLYLDKDVAPGWTNKQKKGINDPS
jgi:hypothetical protein